MMRRTCVFLLVALALSSATAESVEACNASRDVDGTCAATASVSLHAKALHLEGYLEQLAALRAEAQEMRTASCAAESEPRFAVVEGVQDRCPEGFEIASAKECRDAIQEIGVEAQMVTYADEGIYAPNVLQWSVPTWPMGCSLSHKTRINFGVFNANEAGKGDERVSLICRTSAWEEQPEAQPWTGGYERLEGVAGCPFDLEIASAAECGAAIGALELESHDVIEDLQTYRPSGCSYYKDGRPGFPTRGLFNKWKSGRADVNFDPICRKPQPIAAAAATEEEPDIEDDLETEDRDYSRLSMAMGGVAGFAGGLSK